MKVRKKNRFANSKPPNCVLHGGIIFMNKNFVKTVYLNKDIDFIVLLLPVFFPITMNINVHP